MASGLCAALTGRTHGRTDQPANVKKTLANSEPSTHGTKRTYRGKRSLVRFWSEAEMPPPPVVPRPVANDAVDGAHSAASRCHRVVTSKRTT
jgi:hypothetical protein